MKKSFLFTFLLPLLLVGCNNTSESSSASDPFENSTPVESSETSSSSEESSSIEQPATTVLSFTAENAPSPVSGGYPTDEAANNITVGGIDFTLNQVMKGGGEYDGTVQMRKETSYLYSKREVRGDFTLKVMRKALDYGDFTGIPTLYCGDEMNPRAETEVVELQKAEEDMMVIYTGFVDGFITLADESSYALYFYSMTIA